MSGGARASAPSGVARFGRRRHAEPGGAEADAAGGGAGLPSPSPQLACCLPPHISVASRPFMSSLPNTSFELRAGMRPRMIDAYFLSDTWSRPLLITPYLREIYFSHFLQVKRSRCDCRRGPSRNKLIAFLVMVILNSILHRAN